MKTFQGRSGKASISWTGLFLLLATLVHIQPASADRIEPQIVLSHRSNEGPSVAAFNGQLFIAYIGTDSRNLLNVAASSDGINFGGARQFESNSSNFTPAIAAYNGKLYLAWAGKDNFFLNIASSTDGVNFANKVTLSIRSLSGPALGVANGKLYLAWTAFDPTRPLQVTTTTDGVNFPVPTTLTLANGSFPPTLMGAGNVIYLAFTSPSGQQFLLSAPGDVSFTGSATGKMSQTGPGLGSFGSELYLAWINGTRPKLSTFVLGSDNRIIGSLPEQELLQSTIRSPAVAGFNGHVFYFWTGTNSNRNLNVATVK